MKIYGTHTVTAVLSAKKSVSHFYYDPQKSSQRFQAILDMAKEQGVICEETPRNVLDKMTGGALHQGMVAEFTGQRQFNETHLDSMLGSKTPPKLILVLDEIQDPHNLGACMRSAEVFGVDVVIAPLKKSASLTAAARKVASGGAEIVPFVQITNLARTLHMLKEHDYWVVGMAGEGATSLYNYKPAEKTVLVVGREGYGLRRLTREICDVLCFIPMYGHVESLNVSVATGIALSTIKSLSQNVNPK